MKGVVTTILILAAAIALYIGVINPILTDTKNEGNTAREHVNSIRDTIDTLETTSSGSSSD